MIMHVNKVHHVTTITRVAANLDEDWLCEVASEMGIEDGVILGLWRRRRRHPGVHRLRYRKPDRARSDVQRKSNLAQALTADPPNNPTSLRPTPDAYSNAHSVMAWESSASLTTISNGSRPGVAPPAHAFALKSKTKLCQTRCARRGPSPPSPLTF